MIEKRSSGAQGKPTFALSGRIMPCDSLVDDDEAAELDPFAGGSV
ncbi:MULTISPECIES: hypothetical protein [Sphingobium]|nr:hypothetical protein [Sphingobium indicum]